jgi:hypothetical protein
VVFNKDYDTLIKKLTQEIEKLEVNVDKKTVEFDNEKLVNGKESKNNRMKQ